MKRRYVNSRNALASLRIFVPAAPAGNPLCRNAVPNFTSAFGTWCLRFPRVVLTIIHLGFVPAVLVINLFYEIGNRTYHFFLLDFSLLKILPNYI